MAFCTKCGRSLQDGEVCACQSAAQPQVTPVAAVQVAVMPKPAQPNAFGMFFKGLWENVMGVLKTPVTTINTYVEKADMKISCTLIGINALVVALITWFGMLQANAKASKGLGLDYSDFDSLNDLTNWYSQMVGAASSKASTTSAAYMFKQMCCSALFIIAAAAVVALVIMVSVNTFGKAKATYVQGIAIVSLSTILAIPAAIIAYLFGLFGLEFFSQLGSWVSAFAAAVGTIFIFFGVRVVCKDENKLPLVAGLCAVGSSISVYLIGLMFR